MPNINFNSKLTLTFNKNSVSSFNSWGTSFYGSLVDEDGGRGVYARECFACTSFFKHLCFLLLSFIWNMFNRPSEWLSYTTALTLCHVLVFLKSTLLDDSSWLVLFTVVQTWNSSFHSWLCVHNKCFKKSFLPHWTFCLILKVTPADD